MKEKYDELKLEVVEFEDDVWTQQGISVADNTSVKTVQMGDDTGTLPAP